MQQQTGYLSAPSSDCDKQQGRGASVHCVGELDTNNRGVGASKVDAAAQDGVGSSTPGSTRASALNATIGVTASELNPGASELDATIGVTIQARSTRD